MTSVLFLPPPCRYRLAVLRYVGFFLFSFFLLMWLSPDSFMMAYWSPRCDSAWFFTCGKAWMEGMTPYVDFADSKGLLLWLIYGIGYLVSPTSYIGVFWLSVVAYTFTFAIIWRTARLFLGQREAAFVLVMMSALLFLREYHDEVRAEDFCMPWICLGIYCMTRVLLNPSGSALGKRAFWLGVSMSWCLLVKWNLFVMMGGMAIVVAVVAVQSRRVSAVACGVAGIILPLLPFAAYLLAKGCFADMVNEYFVNTFLITDNGFGQTMWDAFVVKNSTHLPTTLKTAGQCVILVALVVFCLRRRFSWWLLLAFIPFFLFIVLKPCSRHYTAATIPFFVYPLCEIARLCSHLFRQMTQWKYCVLMLAFFFVGIAFNVHINRLAFMAGDPPEDFVATEKILMRKPFCKIVYSCYDIGWGLRARALPGCKYWALQVGASETMKSERAKALAAHKVDFYIAVPDYVRDRKWLRSCGYRKCQVTVEKSGKTERIVLPVYAKE